MPRGRVCIVRSDHPFPKCNCDAVADIPATHFPCAPARELSSAAQKGICWQENKICSVVWTHPSQLPTLVQTFPAGGCARDRDEATPASSAHGATCLAGPRAPSAAVCSCPRPVLVQSPAPICELGGEKKIKKKRNACSERVRSPTSILAEPQTVHNLVASERHRPWVCGASFCI